MCAAVELEELYLQAATLSTNDSDVHPAGGRAARRWHICHHDHHDHHEGRSRCMRGVHGGVQGGGYMCAYAGRADCTYEHEVHMYIMYI